MDLNDILFYFIFWKIMLKVEKLKTFIQKFYIFLKKNEITFKKLKPEKRIKLYILIIKRILYMQ